MAAKRAHRSALELIIAVRLAITMRVQLFVWAWCLLCKHSKIISQTLFHFFQVSDFENIVLK